MVLALSDSLRAGRLGVERVGLMEEGGVMELEVSIVEDDLPETSSTLCEGFFAKLALERRRSCLKKGMIWGREREGPSLR